jgi:hypothetical protein
MRHFPLRELGYAIGFIVVLTAIYVGAYYATVERARPAVMIWGSEPWPRHAEYRIGGDVSAAFISPMERLDRKLFPESWLCCRD